MNVDFSKGSKAMIDEIEKLLTAGCLGFYDQVEVTEIVAFLPDKSVINVFTIIVAEERNGAALKKAEIINDKHNKIKINPLKNWSFGIYRYTKSITDILTDFLVLNTDNKWLASGNELIIGKMEYQPPKFVTPDSFERIPLNNVLKNNFWNGSYVAEWFDKDKSHFAPFFDKPNLLQELSEEIQKYCPIALASVSDRLGNKSPLPF